jgi:hypothetical protein
MVFGKQMRNATLALDDSYWSPKDMSFDKQASCIRRPSTNGDQFLTGVATSQPGPLLVEREGRVVSRESYASNILPVTMSIDRALGSEVLSLLLPQTIASVRVYPAAKGDLTLFQDDDDLRL